MKSWSMFVGLLGLVALSGVALADISGGPVFEGGGRQAGVRCMVFNAGPGVATITAKLITTGDGAAVDLDSDSCPRTLGARRACVIAAAPVAQVT
jgi:hypothetical protein